MSDGVILACENQHPRQCREVRRRGNGIDFAAHGAVLGVGRELPVPGPRWQADFVLYTTFATSEFQRKDFGVTPAQSASSGYPAFDPKGGYRAVGGQLYLQYAAGERWLLRAETGYERYASDVRDSPIVRASGEFEASITVLYKFR